MQHQEARVWKLVIYAVLPTSCCIQAFPEKLISLNPLVHSAMGMYVWCFATYGSIEARRSQLLSCEKGDSSLTSTAMEAHAELTSCKKKGYSATQKSYST